MKNNDLDKTEKSMINGSPTESDGITRITVIDLNLVIRKLFVRKKMIIIPTLVTAVLSSILIVCVPRKYSSQVMLAPEEESIGLSGSLSDLASSFGFDIGGMKSSDAIYPMLYPDLFKSNDFIVELLKTKVEKLDGSLKTTYLDYLMNYQKCSPWARLFYWAKSIVVPKSHAVRDSVRRKDGIDPFMLTRREYDVVMLTMDNIKCTVDKKTNVITISVLDQDPLICATMADSACSHLQNFITQYRTSKARADFEYYSRIAEDTKREYENAVKIFSDYCDSHKSMALQAYISRRDELESDMDSKFTALTALNNQIQATKARIQEKTPAFTILQNASVPIKPSTPKRMVFVFIMTFMAILFSSFVALKSVLAEME